MTGMHHLHAELDAESGAKAWTAINALASSMRHAANEASEPATVRRLCCEAEILPAVLDGEGEVVDLGRSQRLANRAQRRALRSMYRTCGFPGCDVSFDRCEIHHVYWWERAATDCSKPPRAPSADVACRRTIAAASDPSTVE
jgi:hypothetical protein